MEKICTLVFIILSVKIAFCQIPSGYYTNADNKSGVELQSALHDIIDQHTVISYDGLWNAFYTTDIKSDGKVWDIYSDIPEALLNIVQFWQ
jgi:adenylate kinase family enzyme